VTLTNRPFFAGQSPLSEVMALDVGGHTLQMQVQETADCESVAMVATDAEPSNQEEVIRMDTNLIQALGLEGEVTPEQATEAVVALSAEIETLKAQSVQAEADKTAVEQAKATLETRVVALENDKIVSQALASNRITPAEQGAAKQILASDGGVALFDTVYPTDRKAVPLGEVGTTAAPASEDSQNLSGSDAEYKAIQLLDANPDKWKSVSAVLADNPDLRAAIERDFGV